MMKHTTSDSDVTSLATTSPSRSPKMSAYYVKSPSRDSRESSSTQATPVYNSPLESPSNQSSVGPLSSVGPHSRASSVGPHSRASSASRFSGNIHRSPSVGGGVKAASRARPRGHGKGWHEVDVIDEDDGEYNDDEEELSRGCVVAFWFSVLVLAFTLVCLIVWGAARRYKPTVIVKSLTVENFYVSEGVDHTGVPTKLVTMNSSLQIDVHNPSTMFGIHVSSTSIQLMYLQIPIANGQLQKFYQPKTSRHTASMILHGEKIPLYGAGATFSDTGGAVPLTLDLALNTRGYVIGRLVRVTHAKRAECPVILSSRSDRPIRFAQSACTYT